MMIDMHCHWLPETLVEELRSRKTAPRIATDVSGRELLHIHRETLPYSDDYANVQARLEHLERHGVDRQVLSLAGLFGVDSLPAGESGRLTGLFNDALVRLVRSYPARFSGLAALPLVDLDAAVAELRRAVSLGLIGAILPADGFLNRRVAERFIPILDTADQLGAHLFIHPGPRPSGPDEPVPPSDPQTIDNANQRHVSLRVQNRLSDVMVTLTMTDFLNPFRHVSVQIANLGGNLPWLLERMDQVAALREPGQTLPSRRVRERRIFVDCASFGPRALQLAIEVFGADRVLLGTDHPIFATHSSLDAIRKAQISSDERSAVLGGNAATLLGKSTGT
jgi:predicted TIM-barrel fold metal-dependent hydrolase